ncbi:MAG: hypothetical protein ABW046_03940 [Actinoplanes sp.]
MSRLRNPFGLAVLACLILAGWALWSGGILDSKIARQVRSSSVYAAPGTGLDTAAAERVIGNRRLVIVLLPAGADRRGACKQVKRAAAGTLVLVLSRESDSFDTYGCASFGSEFGKSFVSETFISQGSDGFVDRPLEAVKVAAVNYDRLVRAGTVPDGARTISPSLPRYLVAAAAILAVLLGSAFLWLAGHRAGRLAADRQARREAVEDEQSRLAASMAALARRIVDLDGRPRSPKDEQRYRRLAVDYAKLLDRPSQSKVDSLATSLEKLAI